MNDSRASLADLLRLCRFPLVFTVWGNILASASLADAASDASTLLALLSSSLAYLGGMALNDVADASRDAKLHPLRVLPAGRLARKTAAALGGLLLGLGFGIGTLLGKEGALIAGGLTLCVLAYDFLLKNNPVAGALGMASCRFLVAAMGPNSQGAIWGAFLLGGYAFLLTWLSTFEERRGASCALLACVLYPLLPAAVALLLHRWGAVVVWAALSAGLCLRWFLSRGKTGRVQASVRFLLYGFLILDSGTALFRGQPSTALAILGLLLPISLSRWLLSEAPLDRARLVGY